MLRRCCVPLQGTRQLLWVGSPFPTTFSHQPASILCPGLALYKQQATQRNKPSTRLHDYHYTSHMPCPTSRWTTRTLHACTHSERWNTHTHTHYCTTHTGEPCCVGSWTGCWILPTTMTITCKLCSHTASLRCLLRTRYSRVSQTCALSALQVEGDTR
jgi:hypothetical protein